jgi:prepilin-type N-terminal cleavage/methylation domain-containing protein
MKNQKGFTLVELMIVVLVVGVLAMLAIPTYQKFKYRAQSAEVTVMQKLILQNLQLKSLGGSYTVKSTSLVPAVAMDGIGSNKMRWSSADIAAVLDSDQPVSTYCAYQVMSDTNQYEVITICDLDGDSNPAVYYWVSPGYTYDNGIATIAYVQTYGGSAIPTGIIGWYTENSGGCFDSASTTYQNVMFRTCKASPEDVY